uniref:Uncharacterized protein n=1 Tax=Arion vulgaris TaxID=1028688 RepID=A0A0B7B705_9EUPU
MSCIYKIMNIKWDEFMSDEIREMFDQLLETTVISMKRWRHVGLTLRRNVPEITY